MSVVRRQSLLSPDESLLLCTSVVEASSRFDQFVLESGIAEKHVLLSNLCAIPLPQYEASWFNDRAPGQPRRWQGTRAEFMWHPLMWLPARLAGRYSITQDDGYTRTESDGEWAIRVALEMTASGLYDVASGGWVDILATVGLDITDELDLARVQDWLAGEPDEILDAIDLSEYLNIDPSSWALDAALALHDDLVGAAYAGIANELLDVCDTVLAALKDNHQTALQGLRSVASLADATLGAIDVVTEAGAATSPTPEMHDEYFTRVHELVSDPATAPDPLSTLELINDVRERLSLIYEAHAHHLVVLDNLANDEDDEDDETAGEVTA